MVLSAEDRILNKPLRMKWVWAKKAWLAVQQRVTDEAIDDWLNTFAHAFTLSANCRHFEHKLPYFCCTTLCCWVFLAATRLLR